MTQEAQDEKRVLALMVILGLVVSSTAFFVSKHNVFASGTTTASQTATTAKAQDEADAQKDVKEPNYVGSITVTKANAKDEASKTQALQGLAKISQADAEKAALAKVPGTVVKTSLDNENGYLVYSVTIKDANNKLNDVKIDAGTGSVLIVEASDGMEEKASEGKSEEASKVPDTDTVQEEVQSEN